MYDLIKIYIDIDITKLNHFASAISSDGKIIIELFKFKNDADGFQLLVSKLILFDKPVSSSVLSQRHYVDNLFRHLITTLYQVCVVPHQNLPDVKKQHSQK